MILSAAGIQSRGWLTPVASESDSKTYYTLFWGICQGLNIVNFLFYDETYHPAGDEYLLDKRLAFEITGDFFVRFCRGKRVFL